MWISVSESLLFGHQIGVLYDFNLQIKSWDDSMLLLKVRGVLQRIQSTLFRRLRYGILRFIFKYTRSIKLNWQLLAVCLWLLLLSVLANYYLISRRLNWYWRSYHSLSSLWLLCRCWQYRLNRSTYSNCCVCGLLSWFLLVLYFINHFGNFLCDHFVELLFSLAFTRGKLIPDLVRFLNLLFVLLISLLVTRRVDQFISAHPSAFKLESLL